MHEVMQEYLKDDDICIKSGNDVNAIMRDMMSVLLEGVRDEELNEKLGYSKYDYRNKETNNSRNRYKKKRCIPVMAIWTLLLREIVKESMNHSYYQNIRTRSHRTWKKNCIYVCKGMTIGDIETHLKELYDLDISNSTISRITDKIMPLFKEWQECPLQEIYAVVYMDELHYHVHSEGCIIKRVVYIALELIWKKKRM